MRFGSQELATGTGFIVQGRNGPLLITNRHNVTGRNQETEQAISKTGGVPDNLLIRHNQRCNLGSWVVREEPLYSLEGTPRWYEHPNMGATADVIALPLTDIVDVDFYYHTPSQPGPDVAVGPTEIVSVVGFPFGLSVGGSLAIWATGFMASDQLPSELTFLIDCRSRQGQSGSAVVAYRGGGMVTMANGNTIVSGQPTIRFLGIYSGRINRESDLGIVWKASVIAELVASV